MKIGEIDFPESLVAALRDEQLVVFAGAGVSMGEPAKLPNYSDLVKSIAGDTGRNFKSDKETEDRFLGRLKHSGMNVHELVQQKLARDNLAPTGLHKNLLKFYSNAEKVRIVTTNFDPLFEQAAGDEFDSEVKIFRAPALPLGHNFRGIVHIHGAIDRPDEMVLTDEDFGRGYLLEGWARRFLIGLLRDSTVLFIGYSHDDTIMNYLARALTGSGSSGRKPSHLFAMTGENNSRQWAMLGIEPVKYPQSSEDDHSALNKGIESLAAMFRRGFLDWKRELRELAQKPFLLLNDEDTGTVEYALEDAVTTGFFTEAARSPEWVVWFDERGHLESLFSSGPLSEQDKILAKWLAESFACEHADELFLLIAKHGTHLHPNFWLELARKIGLAEQDWQDENILSRWVVVLLITAPQAVNPDILLWVGERCIQYERLESLLQIFDYLSKSHAELLESSSRVKLNVLSIGDHHVLNELWGKGLKPNLAKTAEPVLSRIAARLEERDCIARLWQKSYRESDGYNSERPAIEPHKQNENYPDALNVLIDIARDCLNWLTLNREKVADWWCVQFADSEVPLLRRLATHALSERIDLMADEKVDWLLEHIGLHDQSVHHEIFRAMQQAYSKASLERREKVIEAVLAYRCPGEGDLDKERRTARYRFVWFDWLYRGAPSCTLTKQALDDVLVQYPQFESRDHPDFLCYVESGVVGRESPWTAEELLDKPATYWLPKLLSFQPTEEIFGPDLQGLVSEVAAAAKKCFEWGLGLAKELAKAEEWDVGFWPGLIGAWSEMELDEGKHREVLQWLARAELHPKHERAIVDALYALVRDGGKPYAWNLLPEANEVSMVLWYNLQPDELPEEQGDWLFRAINHSAGVLTEFWLCGFLLWRRKQVPTPDKLSDEYRQIFSEIVQNSSLSGRLGRSVLAGQFNFLLAVDEIWTKENLLPLFTADEDSEDFQAAWDGFITYGRLTPAVAELLEEAFLRAVKHIKSFSQRQRKRFIELYTTMLGYFIDDPLRKWLPGLFPSGEEEDKLSFAFGIEHHLRGMDEERQREWWQRWLKSYWKNRLSGVLGGLNPNEIEAMLRWLPHLTSVFPEAVGLAIKMLPRPPLQHYQVTHELKGSEILQHHPEAAARLVIYYLEEPDSSEQRMWAKEWEEVLNKLPQTDIPPELKKKLEEIRARLGFE